MIKIKIIYDNEAIQDRFSRGQRGIAAHGFSCVIEKNDEKILFDTGWDGEILFKNAEALGVELKNIKKIAISHAHWDHVGSLPALLPFGQEKNKEVYFPATTRNMGEELSRRAKLITDVEPIEITRDIYTTGLMGNAVREQSLIIREKRGLVVITGCAHQGIRDLLGRAKELFNDDIYALIGGLHDFDELELLKGVEVIVPCHCTVQKERILGEFNSLRCGVGCEIEL